MYYLKMIFWGFFALFNLFFAFFDGKFVPLDMLSFVAAVICLMAFLDNYKKSRSALYVHK